MKKPPDAPPDFLPKPLNLCHIYQFHIVDRLLHLEAVRERVRGVKGGQAGDRISMTRSISWPRIRSMILGWSPSILRTVLAAIM